METVMEDEAMTQQHPTPGLSDVPSLGQAADPCAEKRSTGLLVAGLFAGLLMAGLAVAMLAQEALGAERHRAGYCDRTAKALLSACQNEFRDDFWIATASCINESDAAERKSCHEEARILKQDGPRLCEREYRARLGVCDLLGQDRYDPEFDPAQFVDPDQIGVSVEPNPYFPLVVGRQWTYRADDEITTDTVTNKTKLIEGVTCRVVHDVVKVNGAATEITDDWFAQDLAGNIWYCGEVAQELETFEGDDPPEPEIVSLEGTWKAGVEGGQPGILVLAAPQVGEGYREEISYGEAEDVAKVISITGTEAVPAAQCNKTCLVTRNVTPLELGNVEVKYYAPGIGLILEIDRDGNRMELIELRR
jgi:hypothetical protein